MVRLGFVVFALALVSLPAARAGNDSGVIVHVEPKKEEFTLTKEEQEVIDLTNAYRAKVGLQPLAMNQQLTAAARTHAANMAAWGQLSHTLNGRTFVHRAADAGYAGAVQSENIGWNQATPNDALGSWLRSAGHRANIYGGSTEIGVAVAVGPRGDRYWVQVFGYR
jgi:uncharacterized protein YkwD